MSLPWVRLDSHIASHDKILGLLADPGASKAERFQAAFSYVCALGYAGDHATDGRIPSMALPFVHGTKGTARLLVTYRLWEETLTGWQIVNYAERQELAAITAGKRASRQYAAQKGNCVRHHGPGCWTDGAGCGRDA